MKETEDLKNLSLEALLEKKKKMKGILIGIAVPMVIACLALLYFSVKTKNYALIAVAMGCSVTLLPAFTVVNAINSEIKKRSGSNPSN